MYAIFVFEGLTNGILFHFFERSSDQLTGGSERKDSQLAVDRAIRPQKALVNNYFRGGYFLYDAVFQIVHSLCEEAAVFQNLNSA